MAAAAEQEMAVVGMSTPANDALFTARLRAETRGEHLAIEQNRRLRRLSEADLSIPEYVSILVRLAGFLLPVEDDLRRGSDLFPQSIDLSARLLKTELLRRDVAALAPGFDWDAEPFILDSGIELGVPERAWGYLYVFEGATLGGQILARSLHAQLGLTPDHGTAFYNSYGKLTGARWQAFKAALNASVAEGTLKENEIIAGAQAAFHAMNAWMDAGL